MKEYNPEKTLFSIHIPRCGGSSFRRVLSGWFGNKLHRHYFQQFDALPPKHELLPGICIHGHFNRTRGFGVLDYYPEADQVITILREPLEIALSNYFFWKNKAREKQLRLGKITAGGEHDYRDIEDFFKKRPNAHILKFMPRPLTFENHKEVLEKYFLYIGVVEDLQTSVDIIAEKLAFPPAEIGHINPSPRDEELSAAAKQRFIDNNRLAYAVYRYALETYKR